MDQIEDQGNLENIDVRPHNFKMGNKVTTSSLSLSF